ncbi:MAG: ornithine--oxo-acid transaminase [Planctomycetes bacterium]|nr:ornithine--oxo-acid transaminase [Planctomycetota bacterium]MCB9918021.1 ornithine--oxo-acid transaminase [Planctomycetota bacterium]
MRTETETQSFIELEERYSAHNYHPLDVVLTRGEGPYVYDVEGNRYLDCLAAYSAVNQGHCHPRIVAAMQEQLGRLTLTSRAFRNDRFGPLCEKLTKLCGYDKALLMNSGAEAVETAIKAARKWGYERKDIGDGAARIAVFDGNFHGRTSTIVGFSTDASSRKGFGPFAPGFDVYPYGRLDEIREAFGRGAGATTCAVLVEPIQGEAGVIIPPEDFLPGLRALCDEHRVLLICDEIQSGLGRAGALFAHSLAGIRADAVTIGKALSGGVYPVSAFLADDAVMSVFTPGTHGSTYGGNPLACAAADAALDVLIDEDLIARSRELGTRALMALRNAKLAGVREIRGAGLWIGIELEPSAGGARRYCEELRSRGILCKETHEHTIRIAPPLVISTPELDEALATFIAVLSA